MSVHENMHLSNCLIGGEPPLYCAAGWDRAGVFWHPSGYRDPLERKGLPGPDGWNLEILRTENRWFPFFLMTSFDESTGSSDSNPRGREFLFSNVESDLNHCLQEDTITVSGFLSKLRIQARFRDDKYLNTISAPQKQKILKLAKSKAP